MGNPYPYFGICALLGGLKVDPVNPEASLTKEGLKLESTWGFQNIALWVWGLAL